MGVFDVFSLIMIGIILSIFIFLYGRVWKIEEVPLTPINLYGASFVPLSIGFFCGILFQVVVAYEFTLLFYVLIAGQILLIMISDSSGDETVRKLRYGRLALYLIGYCLGFVGIIFLYILVFLHMLFFGISSLSTIRVDWNVLLFLIVGTIIFISSLWGFSNEEKYSLHDTEGEMKVTALAFANIVLATFSLATTICGVVVLGDLLFWHRRTGMNYLAGVLYLPIGIVLLILSTRKLRRYRKQLNEKKSMVELV
ncbi:MAG: hypothetical protein HWN65_15985 [Candidatus Helarchaeota archaeon]|nr:hypothetical protein [Candidatus Helarchaeota archaeon]